ncbi:ubiquitin-protein ligase (E3) [Coemansia sp. RSA 552]|nr:ubiquitin-protein ligase (E3) [Coemansia sp. RSA 552]
MFSGDFKRQRNINLGGRRRNDTVRSSAQSVLHKAHEERQKREAERQRQAAATTIQHLWRAFHDTAAWRQRMRDALDMDVFAGPSAEEDLFTSLADFAVYYNVSSQDIARLHTILHALFGTTSAASRYRDIIAAVPADEGLKWTMLTARLFNTVLKVPSNGKLQVDVHTVLASLADAAAVDEALAPRPLMRALIESRRLYTFLAKCLTMHPALDSSSIATAVRLAVKPLGVAALQDMAFPSFARWILAIPGLPSQIGVAGVTAITRAHLDWCQLAKHIQTEIERQMGSSKSAQSGGFGSPAAPDNTELAATAISMLGNMTAFVLPQLTTNGGPLTALDSAYVQAAGACARAIPSCDLFGAKRSGVPKTPGSRLVKSISAHALKWLNSVLSVQVLGLLVNASCPADADDDNALVAQELLLALIQKWGKAARSAAIDNMFRAVDIRKVGFRTVLHDPQFIEDFAGERARVDKIKSQRLSQFHLLCEVLNRQLETIGDDELFQTSVSLPLSDIRTIARACRNISFALYWSQETPDELAHIRDSAAALTRQLFIRNARHPFVDEDFWLVPPSQLDMASFADKVAEDPMFSAENTSVDDDDLSSEPSTDMSESESESEGISGAGLGVPGSRLDWTARTYSSTLQQRRTTDQMIMTPRIAVLRNIPFVVPFNDRVRLFHALINRDRARLGLVPLGTAGGPVPFNAYSSAKATVRRGRIFEDGFRGLFPVLSGKPVTTPESDNDSDGDSVHVDENAGGHALRQRSGLSMLPVSGGGLDMDDESALDQWPSRLREMGILQQHTDNQAMAFQNAMGGLNGSPVSHQDMFKLRMQITFVDRYGMAEAGIDGGGVFKEFLTSLVREAFDPHRGLFRTTNQNHIYPDPDSMQVDSDVKRRVVLDKYKFLGAIIGKALYEGILVDAPFALFFLGCCVGQLPEFNDLPTLDEDLYNGLVALKNYPVPQQQQQRPGDDEEDEIYRVFGLDFTTTVSLRNGQTKTVPLVPRGDLIKVTSQNRLLYLDLIAQFKLVRRIDAQVKAFVAGLHTVIPENWLRLLFASPLELSRLLCGDSGAIDVADWKRNTVYDGAFRDYGRSSKLVVDFWDIVEHNLTERQRQGLCRFATSCERPPLLGFSELNPRFCISGNSNPGEESSLDSRLPSASTCVNLLKLPVYSSKRILRDKLVTAIESNAGFDLS